MNLLERWEQMAASPLNADRVADFPAPLLHSLHPDALVVGYSIWSHDGAASSAEVTHVVRSSADADRPSGVSTRTIVGAPGLEDPLRLHAPSFLVAFDPRWSSAATDRAARARLAETVAAVSFEVSTLLVDGHLVTGEGFTVRPWAFWRVVRPGFVWTVAVPAVIAQAGFKTALGISRRDR